MTESIQTVLLKLKRFRSKNQYCRPTTSLSSSSLSLSPSSSSSSSSSTELIASGRDEKRTTTSSSSSLLFQRSSLKRIINIDGNIYEPRLIRNNAVKRNEFNHSDRLLLSSNKNDCFRFRATTNTTTTNTTNTNTITAKTTTDTDTMKIDLLMKINDDLDLFLIGFDSWKVLENFLDGKLAKILQKFRGFFQQIPQTMIVSKMIELLQCYCDDPCWVGSHYAAYLNYLDYFLNEQDDLIRTELNDQNNPDRWSTLHIAILMSHIDLIRLILSKLDDVFQIDCRLWTSMHFAMIVATPKVVDFLIEMPAFYQQLRHIDSFGMNPIHLACLLNNHNHLKRIISQGVTVKQLSIQKPREFDLKQNQKESNNLIELYRDHTAFVRFDPETTIIDEHFDWNLIRFGGNLLHWCKNLATLTRLLEMNAFDLNQKNFNSDTPLMMFVKQSKCFERYNLSRFKDRPVIKDSFGFHDQQVLINYRISWAMILITNGCHLNARNDRFETVLHLAVRNGLLALIRLFVIFGARINLRDRDHCSPLHLAAKKLSQLETIRERILSNRNQNLNNWNKNCKNNNNNNNNGSNSNLELGRRSLRQSKILTKQIEIFKNIVQLFQRLGARKCSSNRTDCVLDCSNYFDSFRSKSSNNFENLFCLQLNECKQNFREKQQRQQQKRNHFCGLKSNHSRILILDGGLNDSFINPLIQIVILNEIQCYLKKPLRNYFEIIAGTSFGFITGCSIALDLKQQKLFHYYLRMLKCLKKPLFKWQEFNSKTLESILIEMFGPNRSLSDIFLNHNKHLILCTAIVDSNPARLQLIDHNINGNLSLWKACRVSGASVGLYKTYDLDGSPYFDGSLVASNPTIDILGYCHEIFQSQCRDRSDRDWNRIDSILNQSNDSNESIHSINFVLSIGAGKLRSVENFQPIDSIAFTANLKKYFDYYRQLRNWFVSILTETDDWIVER
ncbi:85/88 kDa calcium-independent phospholipase A2 [Sarcoptes scabiei]|uniref:phospholipase A2 n=1 Tax=Sarcoptes scabiei TaxID=52283 RepID=A0A834R709_SARSC|nr:85/88 kDa calcium-independent phospholipase A2 [Sarcoptes scabiei]